jgi:nucleosome binding factor SPN SPT16 subunit
MKSRTRGAGQGQSDHLKTSEALADHQTDLEEEMRQEALRRLKAGEGGAAGPSGPVETPIAYRSADMYPTTGGTGGGLKTNMSMVDGKQEAVLLPIFGRLVPFSIQNVKNVSKNEEGGWTFLRLNFVAPSATVFSGMPPEAKPTDHFIRELTLKARVPTNLNNTFRLIKELRKRVMAREKQADLERDLVTQASLQLIRTGKIHRLRDVHVRPTVGGKKAPGVLEIHSNGLRFNAARGEKLDLIFGNVKLAFFQAAEKEILVLLHFHLKDPIMIGKKKTKDVQFYFEVMESSYALDATRRSGYDPDELEEEQRERQMRNRMNKEFQIFVKRIEEQAKDLEFEIPYRELGFYGVPPHNKSTCFIMPCVNALIELTEPPWFVVPLGDIEVAHFERIVYGLKNFDLVLVMKDFTIKPVQVSAVNVEHLDALKTWLDQCNIKFYEGPANLNWNMIMKHITTMGLEEFYEEGGWKNVLSLEADSDEEEVESESESEFEPSDSEEEEEDEDSDDEDDYEDSESESEGEESMDSDESEGKDFDELEEEAKAHDKSRGRYEDDERPKGKGKSKRKQEYSASESDSDDGGKPKKKASKGGGGSSSKSSKPSSGKFMRK